MNVSRTSRDRGSEREHAEHGRIYMSPVYPKCVWPVGFDGDGVEALLFNQAFGYIGTVGVKLVRPM